MISQEVFWVGVFAGAGWGAILTCAVLLVMSQIAGRRGRS